MVLLIVAYYTGVVVTLTSDFGLLKSCVEHISYTIWHRNRILGIHVGVVECCKLFFGHCDLDRWPQNLKTLYLQHISHICLGNNLIFCVDASGC